MSDNSSNNKRIAKNTILLFARMLLLMGVSLYTSRVTLDALGVDDYGIYNVVGGVVAMFTILSGSLTAAIQRFLTFELGKGDVEKLKTTFSTSVNIQVGLSLFILVLCEIVGVWFLNAKMNIAAERMVAANWVLQCSIVTFSINLISVPYNAAIIAHEKMSAFAYISILEALFKLGVVLALYLTLKDRLILYAVLLTCVAVILRLIYGFYCKKHFEECSYHFVHDKGLLRKMAGFAGWNFIGSAAGVLRNQGVNILLNMFCGTVVNAAQGVATHVNSAVYGFVANFMTALNPQITKSYATGNMAYLNTLLCQGARLSYYMFFLLSLPVLIETETLLGIWLVEVPAHSVAFVRLILLTSLIDAISGPLITAMLATGDIKKYQIWAGGLNLLTFPLAYIALKLGVAPEVTLIIGLVISNILLFMRIILLRGMFDFDYKRFITKAYGNILIVSALAAVLPFSIYFLVHNTLPQFICVCTSSAISCLLVFYFIGCNAGERAFVNGKIALVLSKIRRK